MGRFKELGQQFGLIRSDDDLADDQAISDLKMNDFKQNIDNGDYANALDVALTPKIERGQTPEEARNSEAIDSGMVGMGSLGKVGVGNGIKLAEEYKPKVNQPIANNLVTNAAQRQQAINDIIEQYHANDAKKIRDLRPDLDPEAIRQGNQLLMNDIRIQKGQKIK